jgi:hypothetical protein
MKKELNEMSLISAMGDFFKGATDVASAYAYDHIDGKKEKRRVKLARKMAEIESKRQREFNELQIELDRAYNDNDIAYRREMIEALNEYREKEIIFMTNMTKELGELSLELRKKADEVFQKMI